MQTQSWLINQHPKFVPYQTWHNNETLNNLVARATILFLVSCVFMKIYSAIKGKEFYLPTMTICLRNVRRNLLTILQTNRFTLLTDIYIQEWWGKRRDGGDIWERLFVHVGCATLLTTTKCMVCRCVCTTPPSTFVCIVWWVSTRVQIACTTSSITHTSLPLFIYALVD